TDDLIGRCTLEGEEPRAPRASWYAQRYRIVQEANDLRIVDIDGTERPLSSEPPTDQRQKFLNELSSRKEWAVDRIKQHFGLREHQHLSIERGERKKVAGNSVEAGLRKLFKKDFTSDPMRYIEIYEEALDLEQEVFEEKAQDQWSLSPDQVTGLFKLVSTQPKGYTNFSIKAIKNLLPHLEAGMTLPKAKETAGYIEEEVDDTLNRLPLPDEVVPNLTNPIVKKALFEVRRVVNAIVREYGKPKKIVVELGRDTKGSARERDEMLRRNKRREAERERIEATLREGGIPHPSGTDVLKYRLWEECDRQCPYTGRMIGFQQLFGPTPEVQIEHIMPYSRSLDDSAANKTLCFIDENANKGNRTPFEHYGGDPDKWEEFLVRVSRVKDFRKRRKLKQKNIDLGECISRQLNDSRYISKQVRLYLRTLGIPVDVTRG
ncbi:MAG: type II CRISPR RNA-guided endonuclease Cas9, partial [Candidatus Omnitrophica bacterium]|nr:type II CRISPR RNA-guided endonuclease Cas9 [Candidatus Omnitrophota bacterium]